MKLSTSASFLSLNCGMVRVLVATSLLALSSVGFIQAQRSAVVSVGSATAGVPEFYPLAAQKGQVGRVLTYQTAADNSPSNYSAAGLPDGLSIDAASGLISGKPTKDGNFNATLSATNGDGTGTTILAFVITSLPVVTLTVEIGSAFPAQGIVGTFLLTRTGDLSEALPIEFTITGSAKPGVDFQALSTSKTLQAGKASKRIHIQAVDESGKAIEKKTVKLTLEPSPGNYQTASTAPAKVKIYYTP